jgi:hypothetical protein
VQRTELLDDEEPEDNDGAAGIQEILPPLPEAHAAQRGEVTPFSGRERSGSPLASSRAFFARDLAGSALCDQEQGRKLNG